MHYIETSVLEQPYASDVGRRDQTALITGVIRFADSQTAVISDRVIASYSRPLESDLADTVVPSQESWEGLVEEQGEVLAEAQDEEATEARDATAQLSDQRVTLLRRKYRAGLSPEQAARLQMLTEHLLSLLPVATPEDYEALSSIMEGAAEIDSETNAAWERIRAL